MNIKSININLLCARFGLLGKQKARPKKTSSEGTLGYPQPLRSWLITSTQANNRVLKTSSKKYSSKIFYLFIQGLYYYTTNSHPCTINTNLEWINKKRWMNKFSMSKGLIVGYWHVKPRRLHSTQVGIVAGRKCYSVQQHRWEHMHTGKKSWKFKQHQTIIQD